MPQWGVKFTVEAKEDLDKLEEELIGKISEIEKSDFKCSGSVLCINCEYKILCNTNP